MKRITAKIDEYQKDGQTKGKRVDIGVIMSNEGGEYMMLNPTVDLSGVLMRQRILAQKTGKKVGDSVMCSIWDNSQHQTQHPQNQLPQQADSFDDDIPF